MSKNLLIVESPTKARTLKKYLPKSFQIMASKGHIKDLPIKEMGIDIENGFSPDYQTIKGKAAIIQEIKREAKKAEIIYLAPDPDREGEAIAWHIAQEIGKDKPVYRILFHEFTQKKINEAVSSPSELNAWRYESQVARRILDRLVGYKISPILWEKVRRGLSAGRVQSIALRIICEREQAIRKFVATEYWSFDGDFSDPREQTFTAKLFKIDNKKFEVGNSSDAEKIARQIQAEKYCIEQIEKKERRRQAYPPFITSTIQQEAFRKFRFSAKKTMMLAQKLYEGVELGDQGLVGLITYMRTDSVRLSEEAIAAARALISQQFGAEYVPEKANYFRNKKSSQDAHEAIRPSSVDLPPAKIRASLSRDELSLYGLIWNRFISCQMKPAVYDQTSVDIIGGKFNFRATGSVLKFSGFLKVYEEGRDEKSSEPLDDEMIPPLTEKDEAKLLTLKKDQHFTEPPARFTESSLIKELEEKGIGRPSTYVSIISNIQDKAYVQKEKGSLAPTELGMIVTELLVESFPKIMDVEFTANMEDELDEIEEGKRDRNSLLTKFYEDFSKNLGQAREHMRNVKRESVPTDISCARCGNPMVLKWGKNGRFLACSNYPECQETAEFSRSETGEVIPRAQELTDIDCPNCGSKMKLRHGRFGRFLSCSRYPDCKGTKPYTIGIPCPEDNCGGDIIERQSKKGSVFYGCSKYPKCTFATWYLPISKPCPKCHYPIMVEQKNKVGQVGMVCIRAKCKHREKVQTAENE
jgi:DNA topoisomerase-1